MTDISKETVLERARDRVANLGDDIVLVDARRGPTTGSDPDFERVSDGVWVKAFVWVSLEHDEEVGI